jgi:GNAT superfamily N-acetyltransferase
VIEFRQTGQRCRYCKRDENGEYLRDERGHIVDMSEEEVIAAQLPVYDTTVTAFDGPNPVGMACDEFGATGVYVSDAYQRHGIGTELLRLYRNQFKKDKQIGQMTHAGERLTRSYFRKHVQQLGT